MAANPDETQSNDHLARIQTQWTMVLKAHSDSTLGAEAARHELLDRYRVVVYRYLLGAVHDEDTAEELPTSSPCVCSKGPFTAPVQNVAAFATT